MPGLQPPARGRRKERPRIRRRSRRRAPPHEGRSLRPRPSTWSCGRREEDAESVNSPHALCDPGDLHRSKTVILPACCLPRPLPPPRNRVPFLRRPVLTPRESGKCRGLGPPTIKYYKFAAFWPQNIRTAATILNVAL